MRVLLLNQFFWPDNAPTGVLLEDVARALVARGCQVTVICGQAAYVEAREEAPPPVTILRTGARTYSRGAFERMSSWLSFLAGAAARCTFSPRYDLVLTLTSPPGLSVIGAFLKRLRGARFWIWEMDVYPDVANATGVLPEHSFLSRLAGKILDWSRRQADGILALGECMKERLLAHGLDPEKVHVVENWVHSGLFHPLPFPNCPPFTVLYSGNFGVPHETGTVGQALLRFKGRQDFRFVFTGGGVRWKQLRRFCETESIGNAEFREYVDRSRLAESFGACHLGLVTLKPECAGTVVPSKAYAFLAAGRPFLFIGPANSATARLARQGCGWAFEAGDVDGVVSLLEELRADPSRLTQAGARARQLFEERYEARLGAARVVSLLLGSTC
jgi:colanic acid biosynthesis glycosyl transferase WcaI